jgi:hypothetical protein
MMCRKRIDDVETGGMSLTRDKSGGWPDCCPDGIRHEGGVTLHLAFVWNVGTEVDPIGWTGIGVT